MAFVCSCQVASELLRAVERAGEDIGHTERLRALALAKRSEIPHSDVSSEGGGRARTCLPWRPPLFPKASRFLGTSKPERPQLAGVDQRKSSWYSKAICPPAPGGLTIQFPPGPGSFCHCSHILSTQVATSWITCFQVDASLLLSFCPLLPQSSSFTQPTPYDVHTVRCAYHTEPSDCDLENIFWLVNLFSNIQQVILCFIIRVTVLDVSPLGQEMFLIWTRVCLPVC